ncbi:hypothetical protein IAD21_05679 [Abditibacteriota bacterium]|nr:hypothetical protein IAD21_05679 [Abditibacteriota bacterium]
MKIVALKSKLAVAAPLALVGIFGISQLAPLHAAPAGGKKGGKKGLAPKMQANIEAAMGKPLTDEQKTQIADAAKTQREAVKDAQDKFDAEVVRVTGLTLDQVHALKKKKPAAAPAAN